MKSHATLADIRTRKHLKPSYILFWIAIKFVYSEKISYCTPNYEVEDVSERGQRNSVKNHKNRFNQNKMFSNYIPAIRWTNAQGFGYSDDDGGAYRRRKLLSLSGLYPEKVLLNLFIEKTFIFEHPSWSRNRSNGCRPFWISVACWYKVRA